MDNFIVWQVGMTFWQVEHAQQASAYKTLVSSCQTLIIIWQKSGIFLIPLFRLNIIIAMSILFVIELLHEVRVAPDSILYAQHRVLPERAASSD